jgi:hypothetical protein
MTTGLDSFSNPSDIGALYPFQGTEVALAIIAIVLWIGWHVKQMLDENKEYAEALELYRRIGIERALHFGGGSHIATEEEIAQIKRVAAQAIEEAVQGGLPATPPNDPTDPLGPP